MAELYELLIMRKDNVNESLTPEQKERSLYKRGDIVRVQPKGHRWGVKELKKFLILTCELEYEESLALECAADVVGSIEDTEVEGLRIDRHESICRRRHCIDLNSVIIRQILPFAGAVSATYIQRRIEDEDDEYQPVKDMHLTRSDIIDKSERDVAYRGREVALKRLLEKKGCRLEEYPPGSHMVQKVAGRREYGNDNN